MDDRPTAVDRILARIDEARTSRDFPFASDRQWCEAAGLSPGYISAMRSNAKSGKAETAKVGYLEKLARAAHLDPRFFLDDKDGRQGPPNAVIALAQRAVNEYEWESCGLAPRDIQDVIRIVNEEAASLPAEPPIPVAAWRGRIGDLVLSKRDGAESNGARRRPSDSSRRRVLASVPPKRA